MKRNKGAIMWTLTVILCFITFTIMNTAELRNPIFQRLGDAELPLLLILTAILAIMVPLSLCTMFWEIKYKYDEEDEAGKEPKDWFEANRGIQIIAIGSILLPLIFILYPIGCIHLFFDIKRKYYY